MANLVNIGALSGTQEPVATTWGDTQIELLIASGGNLQHWDGTNFATISASPVCNIVTKRDSRVVVTGNNGSTITMSGTSDPYNWTIDGTGWTDSDAIWVNVGDKSGGYINAMCTLSKDLVVFKTDGSVYRLTGSYPDWSCLQCGARVWNLNRFSAIEVDNDVWFLDRFFGLCAMTTSPTITG